MLPVGCRVCKGSGQLVPPRLHRQEEGVSISDCEAVSRPLSDALDEADPIEGSYVLEVSSAGADRVLKKEEHFRQFTGAEVELRLYRPREGKKDFVGNLVAWADGNVTVEAAGEQILKRVEDPEAPVFEMVLTSAYKPYDM